VEVTVSGAKKVLKVKLDEEAVDPDDVEMLQDLIVAAVNEGMKKAQQLMQDKLQGITGGLNIPGMF